MAEQTQTSQEPAAGAAQPSLEESWREVGQHFQVLGQSLAKAVKAAWESEETRQQVKNLQTNLQGALDEVSQAVKEVAASPEGQQVQAEVGKAAQSAQAAGQQAWQEAQPHLLAALHQLRVEVDKMIGFLEKTQPAAAAQPETSDDSPQI
jgi:hypothetical protein